MINKKHIVYFPIFLVMYQLASYLANDMYVPALPEMANYFGCSREWVEYTVASFVLGSGVLTLFVGMVSQKVGRRHCLIASGVLFLVASIGCTMATHVVTLLVWRFLQGSVICCIMVAGYSTIQEIFQDEQAVKMLGRMTSIAVLAPTVGPVIGSMLLEYGSWKLSFYCVFGIAFVAIVGLYKTMPEMQIKKDQPTVSAYKMYMEISKNKAFVLGTVLYGALLTAFIGWITLSPAMLMTYYGVDTMQYAWIQIPVIGAYTLSSNALGYCIKHFSIENIIRCGFLMSILSGLGLGLLAVFSLLDLVSLVIGMSFLSLGSGLIMPAMNRVTLTLDKHILMDYKTAYTQFVQVFIPVIGCVALSRLYSVWPHPYFFGYYMGALSLLCLAIFRLRSLALRKIKLDTVDIQEPIVMMH